MPTMPGIITKGQILERLESYVNADIAVYAARLRHELVQGSSPADAGEVLGILRKTQVDHLRAHWFSPTTGWWPFLQPIEPIFRQGVIAALDRMLAVSPLRPLDAYWVCTGDSMQVAIAESKQQVTLLLVTPPPGTVEGVPLGRMEPIRVVRGGIRRGERLEAVLGHSPNDPGVPGSAVYQVQLEVCGDPGSEPT